MKKLILLLSAVLFLAVDASAKKIKIYRDGSADGVHYDRVVETSNLFSHTLNCRNPGATTCAWVNVPNIGGFSSDVIELFVMTEISNGNKTGSTNYNGKVYVVWNYNPITNVLEIDMDDEI
jgi:hypothetical protein